MPKEVMICFHPIYLSTCTPSGTFPGEFIVYLYAITSHTPRRVSYSEISILLGFMLSLLWRNCSSSSLGVSSGWCLLFCMRLCQPNVSEWKLVNSAAFCVFFVYLFVSQRAEKSLFVSRPTAASLIGHRCRGSNLRHKVIFFFVITYMKSKYEFIHQPCLCSGMDFLLLFKQQVSRLFNIL